MCGDASSWAAAADASPPNSPPLLLSEDSLAFFGVHIEGDIVGEPLRQYNHERLSLVVDWFDLICLPSTISFYVLQQ